MKHMSANQRLLRLALPVFVLVLGQVPSISLASDSLLAIDNICLAEARRAEQQHGIPDGLLQSITRVEAGRKTITGEYMPWAWTLNDQGEGLFFDTRQDALDYLQIAVDAGDHSVDAGCMQVNTKWHMDGFFELADMLDPVQNADYAASFLLDLHEAHQSWDGAVKHYHSSDPVKHVQYHAPVLAELESYLDTRLAPDADIETAALTDQGNAADTAVLQPDTTADMASATTILPTAELEYGSAEFAPVGIETGIMADTGMPTPAIPAVPVTAQPVAVASDNVPAADPDGLVKKRQPHIARNWQKVEHFRIMLARDAT